MCQYCLSVPCVRGCPNEDEPTAVAICEICEEPIYEGANYLHTEVIDVCEDCMNDMSRRELAELLGAEWKRGDGCYA